MSAVGAAASIHRYVHARPRSSVGKHVYIMLSQGPVWESMQFTWYSQVFISLGSARSTSTRITAFLYGIHKYSYLWGLQGVAEAQYFYMVFVSIHITVVWKE